MIACFCGCCPRTISSDRAVPSRCCPTAAITSAGARIATPSTALMMSPARRPAADAEERSTTAVTRAPRSWGPSATPSQGRLGSAPSDDCPETTVANSRIPHSVIDRAWTRLRWCATFGAPSIPSAVLPVGMRTATRSCQTTDRLGGRRMVRLSSLVEMDHLEHGRECYARRAWGDAYHALLSADHATPLDAHDLDRLATAAYLTGRDLEFQQILERLYRNHVESGDRPRAARCTFWLAITFLLRGEGGRSSAWTARGERLVEDGEFVERGYLAAAAAEQQLRDGHADAAYATAGHAAAIGESFRDADLTAAARHAQGRALIQRGDVAAGLKYLDETMLAVVAGELLPIMTGLMYCSVIDTCRQVYALGRAREWTSAFSRVCEQQPEMIAFTGTCHVHRSEILQLQGAWPDALAEACRACERALRAERKPPGAALYQQAEIYRLRGECAKAEEAYQAASERGCEPQPGLALLRLAQGRTDAACAAIRRLTDASSDRLRRARLLPAYLDIMLAIGDVVDARRERDVH